MNKNIDNLKKIRQFLMGHINDLSAQQLNKIPAGFSNNIIWNMAHMISAQQGICYVRAGLPVIVEEKYFTPYRPGTRPGIPLDGDEIQKIKALMLSTPDRLSTDLESNLFHTYAPWVSHYGVEIKNIEDALVFVQYHEGLHSGIILALKKLITRIEP